MIAKYKGNYYLYACKKKAEGLLAVDDKDNYLITRKKEKSSKEFQFEDNRFFVKKTRIEELTDLFKIVYIVEYDSGFPNLLKKWETTSIKSGIIKLTYGMGFLPGWDGEDKFVCTKSVNKEDINSGIIRMIYTKKDGVVFEKPHVEEKTVDIEELIYTYNFFADENI